MVSYSVSQLRDHVTKRKSTRIGDAFLNGISLWRTCLLARLCHCSRHRVRNSCLLVTGGTYRRHRCPLGKLLVTACWTDQRDRLHGLWVVKRAILTGIAIPIADDFDTSTIQSQSPQIPPGCIGDHYSLAKGRRLLLSKARSIWSIPWAPWDQTWPHYQLA